MSKVHIIAEIATNYFDSLYLAEQSIKKAAEAGADSIKIQIIYSPETYLDGQYEYGKYKIDDVRQIRKISYLSDENLLKLKKIAKKYKILLTATIYGKESLRKASLISPHYFKVASGDINNKELLEMAIKKNKKVIFSTGMSTEKDILRAINLFKRKKYKNFVVMHCVADYPHQAKDSQLGYITKLNKLNVELGFSDHTLTSSAAAVAVSMGVKWVEKHFTLSSNLGGLDAKHSLDPDQLKEYVNEIRGIEQSLSITNRKITENEKFTRKRARRGLYFRNNIVKNKKIERNDLLSVRPENKFDIWNIDKILNKKIKKKSKKNRIVEAKNFL
jgi:N,N'-diacetyllegionaminate synthase